jgi:hypothetical protein
MSTFTPIYIKGVAVKPLTLEQIRKNIEKSFNLGIKAAKRKAKKMPTVDPKIHLLLKSQDLTTDYNNQVIRSWVDGYKAETNRCYAVKMISKIKKSR